MSSLIEQLNGWGPVEAEKLNWLKEYAKGERPPGWWHPPRALDLAKVAVPVWVKYENRFFVYHPLSAALTDREAKQLYFSVLKKLFLGVEQTPEVRLVNHAGRTKGVIVEHLTHFVSYVQSRAQDSDFQRRKKEKAEAFKERFAQFLLSIEFIYMVEALRTLGATRVECDQVGTMMCSGSRAQKAAALGSEAFGQFVEAEDWDLDTILEAERYPYENWLGQTRSVEGEIIPRPVTDPLNEAAQGMVHPSHLKKAQLQKYAAILFRLAMPADWYHKVALSVLGEELGGQVFESDQALRNSLEKALMMNWKVLIDLFKSSADSSISVSAVLSFLKPKFEAFAERYPRLISFEFERVESNLNSIVERMRRKKRLEERPPLKVITATAGSPKIDTSRAESESSEIIRLPPLSKSAFVCMNDVGVQRLRHLEPRSPGRDPKELTMAMLFNSPDTQDLVADVGSLLPEN